MPKIQQKQTHINYLSLLSNCRVRITAHNDFQQEDEKCTAEEGIGITALIQV